MSVFLVPVPTSADGERALFHSKPRRNELRRCTNLYEPSGTSAPTWLSLPCQGFVELCLARLYQGSVDEQQNTRDAFGGDASFVQERMLRAVQSRALSHVRLTLLPVLQTTSAFPTPQGFPSSSVNHGQAVKELYMHVAKTFMKQLLRLFTNPRNQYSGYRGFPFIQTDRSAHEEALNTFHRGGADDGEEPVGPWDFTEDLLDLVGAFCKVHPEVRHAPTPRSHNCDWH